MRLSALHVYPLKSAAAVPVRAVAVASRGLVGDRRWMLVDPAGRFLSQRAHAGLARLRAEADGDALRLTAPDGAVFTARADASARRRASIWDDDVDVIDAGDEAAAWCAAATGMDCRLVRLPDDARRPVDPAYGAPGDEVSLADGYPLLLTTTASLAELNRRLVAAGERPVPMSRFRPNVVVDGAEAFAEDAWTRIRIGEVAFRVVKPCKRCRVVTIDQATGESHREPLRTLATFRRGASFPDPAGVYFGQNLIPDGIGTLRVGDTVEVA